MVSLEHRGYSRKQCLHDFVPPGHGSKLSCHAACLTTRRPPLQRKSLSWTAAAQMLRSRRHAKPGLRCRRDPHDVCHRPLDAFHPKNAALTVILSSYVIWKVASLKGIYGHPLGQNSTALVHEQNSDVNAA